MKRFLAVLSLLLLTTLGALALFGAAEATTYTQSVPVTNLAYVDLGAGPLDVGLNSQVGVSLVVSDSQPSASAAAGIVLPNSIPAVLPKITFCQTSHVWAIAIGGASALVNATPTTCASGSMGSAVTAASGSYVTGFSPDIGTTADAAWSGTGNASLIAIGKASYAALVGPPNLNINGTNEPWTGLTVGGAAQTGTVYASNLDLTSSGGVALGAMANYGTSPGAVKALQANVFVTNAPVLGAGSAIIGKAGIDQTTPGTTNGVSLVAAATGGPTPTIKAGLTTAVVVKSSAGQVYKAHCDNPAASGYAYAQLLNTASGPALGTNVIDFVAIPFGQTGGFALSPGEAFSTGISIGAATTPTGSTAVSTAINCTVTYD